MACDQDATTQRTNTMPPETLAKIRAELLRPSVPGKARTMIVAEEAAEISTIPNSQPTLTTQALSAYGAGTKRDYGGNIISTLLTSTAHDADVLQQDRFAASAANPRINRPRLTKSTTAPVSLRGSQPESQAHKDKMLQSFGGFEDTEGDTQPVETQLFKQFTTSILAEDDPYVERANQFDQFIGGAEDTDVQLYNEDEAADMGLAKTWDEEGILDACSGSFDINAELDGMSPQTQNRLQPSLSQVSPPPVSSPPKFVMPKTPAVAGYKRSHDGDILTSATRPTPGSAFGDAFGKPKNGVSLTQMFDATQFETPRANDLRSDPIFQRPSPAFVTARSSPPVPASSPTKTTTSDPPRATTEPTEAYLTMKESQELRERRRRREQELHALRSDSDFELDDERTQQEQLAERRRQRAEINKQALEDFSILSAPKRAPPSHRKTRSLMSSDVTYVTPARSIRRRKQIIEISDGEEDSASNSSADELAEDMHTSSQRSRASRHDANGVQVPMTSSRNKGPSSALHVRSSPPTSVIVEQGLDEHHAIASTSMSKRSSHGSQRTAKSLPGTQTVAIADSQPLVGAQGSQSRSSQQPAPLEEPSSMEPLSDLSTSRLPGMNNPARQKALLQATATSSIPRPPPPSSPQQLISDVEERMPSSPPFVHAEHSEEDGVRSEPQADLEPTEDDTEVANDVPELEVMPLDHGSERTHHESNIQHQPTLGEDSQKENMQPTLQGLELTSIQLFAEGDYVNSSGERQHTMLFGNTDDDSTAPYQTASSHLSGSPKKKSPPRGARLLPGTLNSTPPPILGLKDIEAERTPGRMNTQDIDLNISILTDEDHDFMNTMNSMAGSSPVRPAKRRKVVQYGRKSIAQRSSPLKPAKPSSPLCLSSVARTQAQQTTRGGSSSEGLDELSKGNDSIFSGPVVVRQASALSRASNKLKPIEKASKSPIAHAKASYDTMPTDTTARSPKKSTKRTVKVSQTSTRRKGTPLSIESNVEYLDSNLRTPRREDNAFDVIEGDGDEIRPISAPNQVFARFHGGPGGNMSYWPATCLASTTTGFRVRFSDGNEDVVEKMHVRGLKLRQGDLVKVNVNNMRKHFYVIQSLADRAAENELTGSHSAAMTDQHGFKTVIVQAKPPHKVSESTAKSVKVPVSEVYIPATRWSAFNDRQFIFSSNASFDQIHTPAISDRPSTPQSRSRRPRPGHFADIPSTSDLNMPATSPAPPTDGLFSNMAFAVTFSSTQSFDRATFERLLHSHGGFLIDPTFSPIFEDLATSASSRPHEKTSKKTNSRISLSGSRASTPASSIATPTTSAGLVLKPSFANYGFVAVIADAHCSRMKYVQALALGLPCLSARWIHDCIARNRLLAFAPYLLPAGQSLFLDGAIRSRILPGTACFDPNAEESSLQNVLARRDVLLKDQNILLVLGRSKIAANRLSAYEFIAYALGARLVQSVRDLIEAQTLIGTVALNGTDTAFDWILIDGESIDDAAEMLFGNGTTDSTKSKLFAPRGKKRKRASEVEIKSEKGSISGDATGRLGHMLKKGIVGGKELRIASDEWVKQSIIIGALMEE